MKKINALGKVYQAERIVKTSDSITGYNGNTPVWTFRGIKDWSQFQLEEGQEWDLPQQLQQDLVIAEAYESLYNEILTNSLAIAEIYEMIIGGDQ